MKRNIELEAAIVARPHDRAVYLVYADWLTGQGDPRGELIRLDAGRVPRDPPEYTERMARRNALCEAHLASWLGDLAGKALHRLQLGWSLGFFVSASVRPPGNATDAPSKDVVAALLACPLALVLKELTIYGRVREIVDATPAVLPATIESLQLFYDPRYEGHERELYPLREKFTKHRRTVNIKPYAPVAERSAEGVIERNATSRSSRESGSNDRERPFVPAEIRAQFSARLPDTDLPDPLPLGRTVNIYYEVPECLDEERSARGIYQVRAGYDGTYYLDCYFETVALTLFSSHYRIRPDGSKEELESLQTCDEAEHVAEHNARVRKILRAKGFG